VNLDKISLGEEPMYQNCASICSMCKVIEGQTQFSNHLYSLITGIKTNMGVHYLFGSNRQVNVGLRQLRLWNSGYKDFVFARVGIYVLA
jgi:hypothetical protein